MLVAQVRSLVAQVRSLLAVEGEVHASLMEHQEVQLQKHGWVWVLQGAMAVVGLHETGSPGLVEVCWAREGGHLECLVLRNLGGPWEDQGHYYDQVDLLGV